MAPNVLLPKTLLSLKGEDIGYSGFIALHNISLSVKEGETIALIGQSGAGKTTLLRRLYAINPRQCGFIHQHHALVPQLSVFHNIYIGRLDYYSIFKNLLNLVKPTRNTLLEIHPIAQRLGLGEKLFTKIGELSGGQQQRVSIGRALYRDGAILMADEPVSSLDMVQREEVMEHIVNAGNTVISCLHSIDLSLRFFQRVIGLKNKAILFDLSSEAVSRNELAELYG